MKNKKKGKFLVCLFKKLNPWTKQKQNKKKKQNRPWEKPILNWDLKDAK